MRGREQSEDRAEQERLLEDGTENPKGEDAVAAAIVDGRGAGLDGSSYVAVQQWVHDLDRFASRPQA